MHGRALSSRLSNRFRATPLPWKKILFRYHFFKFLSNNYQPVVWDDSCNRWWVMSLDVVSLIREFDFRIEDGTR